MIAAMCPARAETTTRVGVSTAMARYAAPTAGRLDPRELSKLKIFGVACIADAEFPPQQPDYAR